MSRCTKDDLKDCSRAWLDAAAESVQAMIDIGYYHLRPRLEDIKAALANDPPEYMIDHRERYRRG